VHLGADTPRSTTLVKHARVVKGYRGVLGRVNVARILGRVTMPHVRDHRPLHILCHFGHLLYPPLNNVFTQDNTHAPEGIPTTLA
jgi:hypothetical protein